MLWIVIGQSGAGKTTLVRRRLLNGVLEVVDGAVPCTECSNGVVAIGRYGTGRRTDGTDTLPYNAQPAIRRQLRALADAGRDVVMEGDRIASRAMFECAAALFDDVRLVLVTCPVSESMRRLRAAGSRISARFVRGTRTKSRNLFLEYAERFRGEVVRTGGKDGDGQ